jgi:hypothetical protein
MTARGDAFQYLLVRCSIFLIIIISPKSIGMACCKIGVDLVIRQVTIEDGAGKQFVGDFAIYNGQIIQCSDFALTTIQGSEEINGLDLLIKPVEGEEIHIGSPSSVVQLLDAKGKPVVLSKRAAALFSGIGHRSTATKARL